MKSLNIGIVFDDSMDRFDGVQQYILTLYNYLTSKGHHVYFFVGETLNSELPNLYSLSKNLKVKFNRNVLSIPIYSLSYKKIYNIIDPLKIDIIHVQMPFSPLMAAKIIKYASANSIPITGSFHILGYTNLQALATKLLSVLTKQHLNNFSKIYSISAPAQNFSNKYYGINSEVLGAPVNIKYFKATKHLNYDKIDILYLGRLVERKAPIDLLKALVYLKKHFKDSYSKINSITIAGSGYQEKMLKSYVVENKLSNKVNFSGYVSEKEKLRLLQSSHISVFPSRGGESFGIVLLEALASGNTLVLAANNPGYNSVLSDVSNQLFKVKDPIDLAKKINWYIKQPEQIIEAVKQTNKLLDKYDVNFVGNKILSNMIELVDKHVK